MSESTGVSFEHDWVPGETDGQPTHLAMIYEDSEEQLETVASFLREGLRGGERCLYVVHDNTVEAVHTALKNSGVDVAAAKGSDALAIHTADEVYLRAGRFDKDAAMEFWTGVRERVRRRGFENLRVATEMTWALDSRTDLDSLAEYEAALNPVLGGEDCIALCQYSRDTFPPEVISDVVHNHPLLVDDGSVTHNTHYEPPAKAEQQHDDLSAQRTPSSSSAPGSLDEPAPAGVQLERSFTSKYLDELIIAILFRCEEANGMDIIREFTHRFDVQFSPGTVYPHLHSLENEGILARRECVQSKEYRIDDSAAARSRLASVLSQVRCLESFLGEISTEAEEADERPP